MTNGTKYRVLMEFEKLVQQVDSALKSGGLITLPMGREEPGTPVTLNPQHVVIVKEGMLKFDVSRRTPILPPTRSTLFTWLAG